eukprot:1158664-Pelagomonas_calceolata.AAC.4
MEPKAMQGPLSHIPDFDVSPHTGNFPLDGIQCNAEVALTLSGLESFPSYGNGNTCNTKAALTPIRHGILFWEQIFVESLLEMRKSFKKRPLYGCCRSWGVVPDAKHT